MKRKNAILKFTEKDLVPFSEHKTVFDVSVYDFKPVHNKFSSCDIDKSKEIYFSKLGFKICLKHRTNSNKIGKITRIINNELVK